MNLAGRKSFRGRLPLTQKGFSLVEILIAIVVLAIGIMGVLGALSYGLHASETSEELSKAIAINRKIMEQALIVPETSDAAPVAINTPPYDQLFVVNGSSALTSEDFNNYTRQVEYRALDNTGQNHEQVLTGSTWDTGAIRVVRVSIFYKDRRGADRVVRTYAFK